MLEPDFAVPAAALPFVGQIRDVDAHDWTPVNHWVECFGNVVTDFAEAIRASDWPTSAVKDFDDTEINADTVWNKKRLHAPGSFDMKRRLDVMNLTGVHSQLLFPGGLGLMSVIFYANSANARGFLPAITGDRRAYARKVIDAYNGWCARISRESPRLRPVAALIGDTVDELITNCQSLLNSGICGIWMPASVPPGGVSPADPILDPLWDMLEKADAPLTSHVGAEVGFLSSDVWRRAPMFEGFRIGDEFSLDPWTLATFHRPTENFIQTMVLGGVFDRFPKLRYGASEVGAGWLGACADMMDTWIQNSGAFKSVKHTVRLQHLPSDYIRRNVRVSPFEFEDVGAYVRRFGLEECYCYGSDFPHIEGGKDPMGAFCRSFEKQGYGAEMLRKFFIDNGKLLLPK